MDRNDNVKNQKARILKKYCFTKCFSFGCISILLTLLFVSSPVHSASCNVPKSFYKNVSCTSDSRYFLAVKDTGEPVALLNKQGKKSADLFAYQQVLAHKMSDGLLPVRKKGKIGYINGKGVVAIPLVYDSLGGASWARSFNNSRVVVKKGGKWGVINTANRAIVPFSSSISNISDYSGGMAEMVKSGVTIIVDTKGQTRNAQPLRNAEAKSSTKALGVNQPTRRTQNSRNNQSLSSKQSTVSQSQQVRITRVHTPIVKRNTEVSLPDSRINQLLSEYKLIPPVTGSSQNEPIEKPFVRNKDNASSTSNENPIRALNQMNNSSILNESINTSSTDSKQADYSDSKMTVNNQHNISLIPKQNADGKWGFDDVNGVNMITYSFDEVTPFSSGLAGVKLANNWGFINKAGDLIIPFRFNEEGVRSSADDTYKGMPPFMFFGKKAWIGSLRDGSKLCIDKDGINVTCDE